MTSVNYAAIAARIQAAWEGGRVCPLAGRAMKARVLRAERAWRAGLLSHDEAARAALEAENVALAFAPLPVAPGDLAG